jgi:murein hydrolase activator
VTSARFANGALVEQDRAIAMGEKARDIVDLMDKLGASAQIGAQLETLPGPTLRPARPGDPRTSPVEQATAASRSLPYRLPVTGSIVAGLGEVSDAGVRARGLTIATRAGAQVVAPAAGRIVFAGPYRGFGQILIIDHGQGWTTLLTSLAALNARIGDSVNEGSPVGRAGPDRPTVTIELRHGNRPIDITNIIR